jgi:DNA-binding MarR family transcriptional regulator
MYENEPGWPEMSVPQFSLLQAIARTAATTHSGLGWLLGLDQTTVSRSLAALVNKGWVKTLRSEDLRERRVSLTASGTKELHRAEKVWRRVQARLRLRYGASKWNGLVQALTTVVAAVPTLETPTTR